MTDHAADDPATVGRAGEDAPRTGVPTWPLACVVAGAFAPAALTRGTGRARLCVPALAMFWMPVLGVYRRHGQLRALDRHAVACLHPRTPGGGLPGSFRRAMAGTVARCGAGAGVLAAAADVGLGRLGAHPVWSSGQRWCLRSWSPAPARSTSPAGR